MAKPITLSFTEATIARMNQMLAKGAKSAFIEQAVVEKLDQLQRHAALTTLLDTVKTVRRRARGAAVRLLHRQRRTH
ncbi:MAG: hypothetical protein HY696_02130 [Deltaproteobacteria bacterium]|nr:hypothetical protein [Deltaproteobacteria bacterium]